MRAPKIRSWCSLLFVLATLQQVFATGALFVRPVRSSQTYQLMSIKTYDATVAIQDQVASTHVDQTFFNNTNQTVEATFIFPLPEGAVISELVYWFNGQRYVAEVREKEEAQRDYNEKIRQLIDPALLQYLGDNLFKLNIAPINPQSDVRFEITYIELLPYEFGTVDYRFLLQTTELSPQPLERVSVQVDATTGSEFKTFISPSHQSSTATEIAQIAPDHYRVTFGDENFSPNKDLLLRFETVREQVDINVLTYTPTVQDSFGTDSFFTLWITPPDSITDTETLPRDIVFTADVSSSMEGERLSQLKAAINSFLDGLAEQDRFNIIAFGTNVVTFQPDLVQALSGEVSAARAFVNGLGAVGLTNIDAALKAGLTMSFSDETAKMLVFLTDGYPTWGELNIQAIVDSARARNTHDARIFPFGIGDDVSKPLLISLARQNGGYPTYISADDSIALVVSNHFKRISKPVLSNLEIDYGSLQNYDRYPVVISDLFFGSQVLQFGRYSNDGTFDISLQGDLANEKFTLTNAVTFDLEEGGNRAVARLWANSKIDELLQQIELFGELDELVNAIIDLSIRFGILTPYTALYSDPTTGVEEKDPVLLPKTFVLEQNYPNPFNPETRIVFFVPPAAEPQRVTIKIYDLLGRLVRVLFDNEIGPGRYEVIWDGKDSFSRDLPSGTYLYKLEAGEVVLHRKMMLVR